MLPNETLAGLSHFDDFNFSENLSLQLASELDILFQPEHVLIALYVPIILLSLVANILLIVVAVKCKYTKNSTSLSLTNTGHVSCGHQLALAKRGDYGYYPQIADTDKPRPPVPGSPTSPDYGSGYGNGRAGDAKNHRKRSSYHHIHQRPLHLATFNTRTLRTDDKIWELEVEMNRLNWSILGLSKVRRQGEDTIILKFGNLFYHREGEQLSQGGVGFLVHKSLVNNVVQVGSVSARVAYLTLRISKRYSLKVVWVYAPTSTHPDGEVEVMYEDISKAIHTAKAHFTVVIGDFYARIGMRNGNEEKVGPFGIGC